MTESISMDTESGGFINFLFDRVEEDSDRYNFWHGSHYHFTVYKSGDRGGYLVDEVSVEIGLNESEAEKLREKAEAMINE